MPLHPTKYAEMLSQKMQKSKAKVWLINTGWSGGSYGVGERMSLKVTRALITAALIGSSKRQVKYFASFWIEAIPIVWFGVLLLLYNLF